MQHTQTHRNNSNYSIISHKRDTRSTTKAKRHVQKKNIYIQTSHGLVSPISLSPTNKNHSLSMCSSSSSSEEDDDDFHYVPKRRLSIADLCNPLETEETHSKLHQLTKDEFEALEGFGRFRHTPPSVFFKDLASHLEH